MVLKVVFIIITMCNKNMYLFSVSIYKVCTFMHYTNLFNIKPLSISNKDQ